MTYENIHSYTNKKADIFTYEKPALLVVDINRAPRLSVIRLLLRFSASERCFSFFP